MPFSKGMIPWNKGKKTGIIPKTAFKKGQRTSIPTEFKKGQPSWNKGQHIFTGGGMKRGSFKEKSSAWKGGIMHMANGYICEYISPKKYIYQHRLVIEKYLKRKLSKFEQVHHLNGVKTDNRIENLIVLSISDHSKLHNQLRKLS